MLSSVRARTYRPTPLNLRRLAAALRRGELVAVPTETVYGLAANALDPEACARIFEAKGRPSTDPLIVHVGRWADVDVVAETNAAARALAEAFWPGPLTMVLPRREIVPDIVSSGLPSVAVRMPRHRVFQQLQKLTGLPLAAPSANPFGYVSPTTAAHVAENLGDRIRHILDGGPSSVGVESTIVDLRDPARPRLLRPGAISAEQIETVLGYRVTVAVKKRASAAVAQVSPGQLTRHYSPATRVVLHARLDARATTVRPANEAFLFFRRPTGLAGGQGNIHALSARGDVAEAARTLFAQLRALDAAGYDVIHVEQAPGQGLADAINDRLRRAAAR